MRKAVKAAIAATLLGVTALTAVEPAQARGDAGTAIAAGIIGLGVGAAIASDHPHYREVQYYDPPPPQSYVYYPPPQYGYYDPDWQARRYWQHRRWEEARRRHWEHERWEHRRWHRDWDDDDD